MKLKIKYASKEEIPEGFESLYTERDGEFPLTEIEGLKTDGDVGRVQEALRKEREEHGKTKDELKGWKTAFPDKKPEDVATQIDEVDELRTRAEAGDKGLTDEQIEEMVSRRVAREKAPLERQITTLTNERDEALSERDRTTGELSRRDLHANLREIGEKAKLRPEAMHDWLSFGERVFEKTEDGSFVSKDQVGVTPGVTPDIVLGDLQQTRPHWWPESVGGGARGGKGGGIPNNPWSADNWNMTKQGEYLQQHGREKAETAAKAAGTTLGGPRPQPKT